MKKDMSNKNEPSRIQAMSAELAGRVAAGEVIARPASVVKELIENSLDAGAKHIEVQLEQGGLRLIQVRDDGVGIHPEDLELALMQHASSKLTAAEQLHCIHSLGFRGEALASIATISHFKLTSRTAQADMAHAIGRNASERDYDMQPAAHPIGTTVTVRDLFYNVPARRKFMRTPRTEMNHIEDVLRRLILSRFDVGFSVYHDKRKLWQLAPANDEVARERRIAKLLNQSFMQQGLAIDMQAVGLRLWGWLAQPTLHRSHTDWQYCYLNGRIVRDRILTHAIRCAYESYMPAGRYPAYILYLECEASEVDVNVHPTKYEVQFRNVRWIHDFMQQSISKALLRGRDPALQASGADSDVSKQTKDACQAQLEMNLAAAPATQVATKTQYVTSSTVDDTEPQHPTTPQATELKEPESKPYRATQQPASPSLEPSYREYHNTQNQLKPSVDNEKELTACNHSTTNAMQVLALLPPQFMLVHVAHKLMIIDAIQAQHVISYERLLTELAHHSAIVGKALLMPQTQQLKAEEMTRLSVYFEALGHLGVELSLLTEDTLALRRLPAFMTLDLTSFLTVLIQQSEPQVLLTEDKTQLVELVANHSRIKAYQDLTIPNIQALLNELGQLKQEAAMAHRSRTFTLITAAELQQRFCQTASWPMQTASVETDYA